MPNLDATTSTLAIIGVGAFFFMFNVYENRIRSLRNTLLIKEAMLDEANCAAAGFAKAFQTAHKEVVALRLEVKELQEKNFDLMNEVEQLATAEMVSSISTVLVNNSNMSPVAALNEHDTRAILYLLHSEEKQAVIEALEQPEWANTVVGRLAKTLVEGGNGS